MTHEEMRALAAKAVTIPSLEADTALDILRDALLEADIIKPYERPKKPRPPAKEERAIWRYYRWATWTWARAEWPLIDPWFEWWERTTTDRASIFNVNRSEDPTRLAGFQLTPAYVLEQVQSLYANGIIDLDQAQSMLEYHPPPPRIVESNVPITFTTTHRGTGLLVPRSAAFTIRTIDEPEGALFAAEKRSPDRG